MVVSFTPNIGLAKPDEAELVANWINGAKLYEDNNIQIADKMDVNLQAYTPALRAQTVNPSLGAGTSLGQYVDIQGVVMGQFILTFLDPLIVQGTGEYGISLPEEVNSTFHTVGTALNGAVGANSVIGQSYFTDASAVDTSGAGALDVVTISTVSYVRIITEVHTVPAKTSRLFTNAQPFVPATGDILRGFFIYRKA